MNFSRTRHLRLIAIGIVALAAGSLVACSPGPEPSPTPTAAFASEEEAFAAAEEVYRAYTLALNQQRSGEADSDPTGYLTGTALEDELQSQRDLEANKISIRGSTEVLEFAPISAALESVPTVAGTVCLDLSDTIVLDGNEQDITPADRNEKAALDVAFIWNGSKFLISKSSLSDSAC